MNVTVADLSECKDLYERSGWKGQYWWYRALRRTDGNMAYMLVGEHTTPSPVPLYPAYDATYLLYMLPPITLQKQGNGNFYAAYIDYADNTRIEGHSRTNPANALCRLAIALFEAGALQHG